MRIAVVCYPTLGGSGIVATELAKALSCKGHSVHLVSSEVPLRYSVCLPNLYFHQVIPPEYPLFRYRPYESALAGRLVQLAESEGVELFHVHYAIPHAVSAYLAQQVLKERGLRVPIITTLHGTDTVVVSQDPDLYPVVRLALRASTQVTAVSQALAEETEARFGLAGAVEVIPNFVDTEVFSPARYDANLRAAYAAPGEYLLVHASNFRPVKQVPQIIQLFARLVEIGVPARLLLIGDGPEKVLCEQQVRELRLGTRVHFVGGIADVAPLLAIGDVFVLASAYESFGLAALEAMACGVPVVAPAVGGLPEVISSEAGQLFPKDDIEAALHVTLRVLEKLPRYRQAARQNALRFRKELILPQYEVLYQKVQVPAR